VLALVLLRAVAIPRAQGRLERAAWTSSSHPVTPDKLAANRQYQAEGGGAPPTDLRHTAGQFLKARQSEEEDPQGALFESTLADVQAWLDEWLRPRPHGP
jgi:hypothetical protein